jgi:hypothetical protein
MSQDQRTRKRAVRPSQGAPAKASSPIPGAGGAADRGAPASEADPKPEARAASPNPTEDLPQSPAAIDAILKDLHGFIAYGELILGELAPNSNYLAPTPGIIKLENWLFYLTSRVFPDLGPFQSSGGTIAVKPPHFDHGPLLSVILRYLDRQAVREAFQRLQSHLIELNKLDPLRPGPRPPTRNRRWPSPLDDADERWEIQMRLDEERARKCEALARDIVTEFATFLEWFRFLRGQLADRLLEGEESHIQDCLNLNPEPATRRPAATNPDVLTPQGPTSNSDTSPLIPSAVDSQKPRWIRDRSELWVGKKLVRTVSEQAGFIYILDEFESQGWPNTIDDTHPKGSDRERLRLALRRLNRGTLMIRFGRTRKGKGIYWDWKARPRTP